MPLLTSNSGRIGQFFKCKIMPPALSLPQIVRQIWRNGLQSSSQRYQHWEFYLALGIVEWLASKRAVAPQQASLFQYSERRRRADALGQGDKEPGDKAKSPAENRGAFASEYRERGCSVLGRPGSDLLFQALRLSTIGAEDFDGRVRDGIGYRLLAM